MQVHKFTIIFILILFIVGCQTAPVTTKINKPIEPKKPTENTKFQNHTVKKGETIYSIAREYEASIADIMIDNKMEKNQVVYAGRILKIRSKNNISENQEFLPLKKGSVIKPIADQRPKSLPSYPSKSKVFSGNIPYLLIPKGNGYSKSINGKVIKNFQDNHYGRPLLGLEIKSAGKQNVKAIHNGAVAFIAENFSGYGRSIAIATNQNELFFIYGLDKITVKVGEIVKIGDSVGSVESGKVLGLKILRNGIFQDPSKIIPGLE